MSPLHLARWPTSSRTGNDPVYSTSRLIDYLRLKPHEKDFGRVEVVLVSYDTY